MGVKPDGPLLRIYEIIVNGNNILTQPIDKHLENFITLNDIMREIQLFFTVNQRTFADRFGQLGLRIQDFTKLVVNILDLSCNYTEQEPTIGAVTKGKIIKT